MPVASGRKSAQSNVKPNNGSRLMQLSRKEPDASRPASGTKLSLPTPMTTSSTLIPPPLLAHHHAREMALKMTHRSEAAEQVARYQAAKSMKSQQATLSHLMSTMPAAVPPSDSSRTDMPAPTHSTERILIAPVMNPARYERMLLQRRLKEEALRREKEAKEARLAAAEAEAVRIGMRPSGRLRNKGVASVTKRLTPQHRLQSVETLRTSTTSLKKSTGPMLPKQNPSTLDFASLQQKATAAVIAGMPPPPRDNNNQIPPPPPLPTSFGTLTYKVSLDTHLMQSLLSFDNGIYTREVFIEDPLQPRQPAMRHLSMISQLPSTQFANETDGVLKPRRLERKRTLKSAIDPQVVEEAQMSSQRPLPTVLKTEGDVHDLCDRLATHAIAIDKATLTHALLSPDNTVKDVYYPKALEKYNTLHARVQVPTRMMRRVQAKSDQRKLPGFHQKEKRFEATFDVRHKRLPAKEKAASDDALQDERKPVQAADEEDEANKSRINSFWALAEREEHRKVWSSREGRRDGRSRTRTLSAGKAKAKRRPISRDEATRMPRHRPRAATMDGTITKYTNGARLQHMGTGLSERYQMYNGSFFDTPTKQTTRTTYQAPVVTTSPTAVLHMPVMIKYTPTVLI